MNKVWMIIAHNTHDNLIFGSDNAFTNYDDAVKCADKLNIKMGYHSAFVYDEKDNMTELSLHELYDIKKDECIADVELTYLYIPIAIPLK